MASGQEIDDSSNNDTSPKKVYKDPDDGRQRFLLELEFVQCLANPTYIHYLAQNRYFEDEAFIGYLKYLQYWQRPEYIKYIMYPHCLYFLELLQNASFRNAMAHPANKELAHRQQFYFWKNYRNNRLKHILPRPLPEPTAAPPSNALPPPIPPTTTTTAASSVPVSAPPVHSPMQYPPGPPLTKTDPRSGLDRRKRNALKNHSKKGFQQPKKRRRRAKKAQVETGIPIPKPKFKYVPKRPERPTNSKGKAPMITPDISASTDSSQPVRITPVTHSDPVGFPTGPAPPAPVVEIRNQYDALSQINMAEVGITAMKPIVPDDDDLQDDSDSDEVEVVEFDEGDTAEFM